LGEILPTRGEESGNPNSQQGGRGLLSLIFVAMVTIGNTPKIDRTAVSLRLMAVGKSASQFLLF
jgi:hypothetical protein